MSNIKNKRGCRGNALSAFDAEVSKIAAVEGVDGDFETLPQSKIDEVSQLVREDRVGNARRFIVACWLVAESKRVVVGEKSLEDWYETKPTGRGRTSITDYIRIAKAITNKSRFMVTNLRRRDTLAA